MSAPSAPRNTSVSRQSDGRFLYDWIAPSNGGGKNRLGYQFVVAKNSSFTDTRIVVTTPPTWSSALVDLPPSYENQSSYWRIRARNADGYGPWSTAISHIIPGLPGAPTLNSVQQVGDGRVRLAWTKGSTGNATITRHEIRVGLDPQFTAESPQGRTVLGTTTTVDILGLPALDLWFQVRARNSAGWGPWSNSRGITVTGNVGDLDGWSMLGTPPAGTAPVLGAGLVRTVDGLAINFLATSGITSGTKTFNIRRTPTQTGLIAGKKYRLVCDVRRNGSQYAATASAGLNSSYGSPVTVGSDWATVQADWTATTTSRTLDIRFTVTAPSGAAAGDTVVNAEMRNVRFVEMRESSPYRCGNTVYEGPLATHFDYACNTVGAAWYVDRNNVVQFRHYGDKAGFKAHFTDEPDVADTISYTDISAAYDTRNTATVIRIQNHGRDAATGDADDADYTVINSAAIAQWGRREAGVDMTLYQPLGTAPARGLEILAETATPQQVVTQIRYNMQDTLGLNAWTFDVQDRILVTFRGTEQPSRILGIHHDLTPTRWMVTLDIAKDA